jgi:hypothetical protein
MSKSGEEINLVKFTILEFNSKIVKKNVLPRMFLVWSICVV